MSTTAKPKTMNVKSKSFWLSYDFGLRGNYNGLFNFLDNFNAKECGNGLSYFIYDNPNLLNIEELLKKLQSEIMEKVAPSDSDRIYIIWKNDEMAIKGKFLFGKRKQAPWIGYGDRSTGDDTSDSAI